MEVNIEIGVDETLSVFSTGQTTTGGAMAVFIR